jgi:formylglycine-generating enzyme
MRTLTFGLMVAVALTSAGAVRANTITLEMALVGDAGNATDTTGYGAVDHAYNIGKYEVTNSQYAAFLNAVDADGANPNSIYKTEMGSDARGGITFTGGAASGAKYTTRANMGDKPVNFVSWYDAARFTNWLNNGQGNGDTETGSYTLSGNKGVISKNVGAQVYIPSEDEWYKAAYYNPANSSYSLYPTQSNTPPTVAVADVAGTISNPGANVANFSSGAIWNEIDNVTTVGSAGAASFCGTFDQGGNVWEWNDAILYGLDRGVRGGCWNDYANYLAVSSRGDDTPDIYRNNVGFRVASAVPEPGSISLLAVGAIVGLICWRRKRLHRLSFVPLH